MPFAVKDIEEMVIQKFQATPRLEHIMGVARLAKELAIKFHLDAEKAYIAGLLHDYMKYESVEEMQRIIADPMIIDKFKDAPQIYHAYAASKYVEEALGIHDEDILNGIRYHVYGRCGMSLFEKIIVISDYAEDSRIYPTCKEVRQILDSGDFNRAMYLCIKYTIDAVIKSNHKPMAEQYMILEELEKEMMKCKN